MRGPPAPGGPSPLLWLFWCVRRAWERRAGGKSKVVVGKVNQEGNTNLWEIGVCEIKYINQLHPARLGYGSCWVFPPLLSSPILSPNDIYRHRGAGSCRQGGAPRSPSPQIPPRRKKEQKGKEAKREKEKKRENAPKCQENTAHPRPLPFKQSGGELCTPLLPFHLGRLVWWVKDGMW